MAPASASIRCYLTGELAPSPHQQSPFFTLHLDSPSWPDRSPTRKSGPAGGTLLRYGNVGSVRQPRRDHRPVAPARASNAFRREPRSTPRAADPSSVPARCSRGLADAVLAQSPRSASVARFVRRSAKGLDALEIRRGARRDALPHRPRRAAAAHGRRTPRSIPRTSDSSSLPPWCSRGLRRYSRGARRERARHASCGPHSRSAGCRRGGSSRACPPAAPTRACRLR
jgi:hypothetical protein